MKLYYICLLVGLQFIYIHGQHNEKSELKTAYAVLDENGEDYVIVTHEPPRDKYVAGARLINSVNQTGYACSNNHIPFPMC